jgi:hypothetical protein
VSSGQVPDPRATAICGHSSRGSQSQMAMELLQPRVWRSSSLALAELRYRRRAAVSFVWCRVPQGLLCNFVFIQGSVCNLYGVYASQKKNIGSWARAWLSLTATTDAGTQSDRAMFAATHAGIPYSHPLISVGSPLGRPSSPKPPLVPPRGSHCPRRTTSSARPRRRQVVNCAPPTSMLPPRSSVRMRVMGRQAQITTAVNFQWW